MIKNIIIYKKNFVNFFKNQDLKTQRKIEYILDLVRFKNGFLKSILKSWFQQIAYMRSE